METFFVENASPIRILVQQLYRVYAASLRVCGYAGGIVKES